jgi:hypothetical protein
MLFTTSVIRIPKKSHSDWLKSRKERREKRKMIATKGVMSRMMKKMVGNRVRKKKIRRKMMK